MSNIRQYIALFGLLMVVGQVQAVPKPSRAPVSWDLKFTFDDPVRFSLILPGDTTPTTYWFLKYRVENDTGQDVQFAPAAELVTSSLKVIAAGDEISPSVYDAIAERLQSTEPFLLEPRHVVGPLLQGEENAKTSVVVFRQFTPEDNEFTIYFSGLSGEIQQVPNPSFDRSAPEGEDNPRVFTLRKTLAIHYSLPGDPQTRKMANPVRIGREWIMR